MRALHAAEPTWSVHRICQSLAVSRSSFCYQPASASDLALRDAIEASALDFPRYGYCRVTAELRRRGILANHQRVLDAMRRKN